MGDWAQIAAAFFTAIAAGAALASVIRIERDRRREVRPELHIEIVVDIVNDETRLAIVNYGGPARDVRVAGTLSNFGFFGTVPPSSHWRPGEFRTVKLSMPAVPETSANAFVEGRDMARKQLLVGAVGGKSHRWRDRKTKSMSSELVWSKLFPGTPSPLEMPNSPIHMDTVDREF